MKITKIHILIIFLFLIILFISSLKITTQESFLEKESQPQHIPYIVHQTWKTKNLPPFMNKCVEKMKKQNPEMLFYLYDDNDCKKFIQTHFDDSVLKAFNKLIPGAFKADLFRYCVLYIKGGIYLDIKYHCINNFKLIELTDKEYFVLEKPWFNEKLMGAKMSNEEEIKMLNNEKYLQYMQNKFSQNMGGIYNALMVTYPKNPLLLNCIEQIVINCENNYYGNTSLDVTGPILLGNIVYKNNPSILKNFELFYSVDDKSITTKKNKFLIMYPEYRKEQQKTASKTFNYGELWGKKQIYNL